MKALFFFLSMTGMTFLIADCGQYGPLYLPQKTPSTPVMKVKVNPQIQASNIVGQPQ